MQDAGDLAVDDLGRVVAVLAALRHQVFAEEDLLRTAPSHGADGIAHAPLAHHAAGDAGGLLEVVGGTRVDVTEHDLLGYAATHRLADEVVEVLLRVRVAFLGQAPGDTQGHAAGEDRDLVQRVGVVQHHRQDGVTPLVDGGGPLLLRAQDEALAPGAHDDAVAGVLEVDAFDLLTATAHCEQCCLVDQVGQVGAAHARSCLGHHFQIDVGAHSLVAAVHLQDGETLPVLGQRHHDLAIEATGTQQRRVEDVGAVGSREDDDALAGLEAVHLCEHLVQRLLALVVAATEAGAALAADGVDLVDEDDGPAKLAGLCKEVAHAAGADTHEHLHEVAAGDGQEADAGLAGDRAGEQRLAGAGGPDQQHALGHAGADLAEAFGHAQEVDHFGDLLLDPFVPCDVGERGGWLVRLIRLGPAAADGHDVAHLALSPLVHPHQEPDDEDERQQQADRAEEPVAVGLLRGPVDLVLGEKGQLALVGKAVAYRRGELRFVLQLAGNPVGAVGERELHHFVVLHGSDELGVAQLVAGI